MQHLRVKIDPIDDDSHWITGIIGDGTYKFYAKVEDKSVSYGVNKGRVVKLVVRKGDIPEDITEEEFWQGVVANYDRSWVIEPKNATATEIFYSIVDELSRIKPYDERIYNGSKVKKFVSKTKKTFGF